MAMKANKALKRLAKIEAWMSDVAERYSTSASHIAGVLQEAKAAVTRAKEAVGLQASSETEKKAQRVAKKAAHERSGVKKAAVRTTPEKAAKNRPSIKRAAAKKTAPASAGAAGSAQ
jgi:hypothetical protein